MEESIKTSRIFHTAEKGQLEQFTIWAIMESVTSSNPCLVAKLVVLLWVWNESLTALEQ